MTIYMIFKVITINATFFTMPNASTVRKKKNENPQNLDLALFVSGVMRANCGSSCAARKSAFCNHMLALMLKICKYTLYNCVNVTELKHEVDQNSFTVCTSVLQT